MALNNYLVKLSESLKISFEEKTKMESAIKILQEKINMNLSHVVEHFCFGSYMRETNLPSAIDPKSDIDYFIVLKKSDQDDPNNLLKYLQEFVSENFPKENIIRTFPTCIVIIENIRFELVPAYRSDKYYTNYKIPDSEKNEMEWNETVPNDLNEFLQKVDSAHDEIILPLIRILKYWNVLNGNIYTSYYLENMIISMDFPMFETFEDYLFYAVEHLNTDGLDEENSSLVNKLKYVMDKIKQEEIEDMAIHNLSLNFPMF